MRYICALTLTIFTMVVGAQASARTGECGGPVTRVTGDKGYTSFRAFPSNAIVDAAGATWWTSQYPKGRNLTPLAITGRTNACLRGGRAINDTPLNIGWGTRYAQGNSAAVTVGPYNGSATRGTVVEGVRLDNPWDGFRAASQATDTTFRGNLAIAAHDDCVENDGKNNVTVDDNLLDGCFVGFSARNPKGSAVAKPDEAFTIRRNLIRMAPIAGWPSKAQSQGPAHAQVFKWETNSLKVRLTDNIFNFSQGARTQFGAVIDPFSILGSRYNLADWKRYVIESSGNVIVWTGPGKYPFATPPGFTVTTDKSVWDRAKQAWLERHPTPARAGA